MRPLPHPPGAERDENSLEMLRGWVVDGELQVSLAAWVWQEEPAQWGRLLAESACHLADAIAAETGRSRAEIYRAVSESVIHHLQHPPVDLEGEFVA
jgi:hypothetical protein